MLHLGERFQEGPSVFPQDVDFIFLSPLRNISKVQRLTRRMPPSQVLIWCRQAVLTVASEHFPAPRTSRASAGVGPSKLTRRASSIPELFRITSREALR